MRPIFAAAGLMLGLIAGAAGGVDKAGPQPSGGASVGPTADGRPRLDSTRIPGARQPLKGSMNSGQAATPPGGAWNALRTWASQFEAPTDPSLPPLDPPLTGRRTPPPRSNRREPSISSIAPDGESRTCAPASDPSLTPAVHFQRPGLAASGLVDAPPVAVPTTAHVIQIADELDVVFPHLPIIGDATEQRLQPPLFRMERVVVRDDGMITLPLIGPVRAAGLTPEQVREELIARYQPLAYDPLSNAQSGGKREYRICVNDELDLRVRNQPEYSDVVAVRPDGKITLQRVGEVVAEGKTLEELTAEATAALSSFLPQPEVTIALRRFHSNVYYEEGRPKQVGLRNLEGISVIVRGAERRVFVMGEVRTPGLVAYRGTLTLNQAVAAAGGPLRSAKLKAVKILRQREAGLGPDMMLVDMRQTIRGSGGTDLPLHHLDVIVLGKTPIARFTDTLEQYVFNVAPFTRNNPNFNFFYSLGGGGAGAALFNP